MKVTSYKQLQFLLWHRNQYRSPFLKRWVRSYLKRASFLASIKHTTDIFEWWFRLREINKLHTQELEKTYNSFASYLPDVVTNSLDIGAGLGGIDILFADKFKCTVYLLDKQGISSNKRGGFHEDVDTFSYYNDFSLTRSFLEANGVTSYEFIDISKQSFPEVTFDLIVSFLSWGFHFSVDTYLNDVYESLNSGGLLVMDLRNDRGGIEKVESKFGKKVNIVDKTKSYTRIAVTK